MVTTKSYREHLLKQLQDKEEAAAYLNAALQDEDPRVFLMALHDVADAIGGIGKLSDLSKLNRENLYRSLSMKGNPQFFTVLSILKACDVEISCKPTEKGEGCETLSRQLTKKRRTRSSRLIASRKVKK
jgi:probable addiction module antidote protein